MPAKRIRPRGREVRVPWAFVPPSGSATRRSLESVKNESRTRLLRRLRYERLAALLGGPLGVALIGRPDLAAALERALAHCPGYDSQTCCATGGVPRVCFVQKMEQMVASVARGGETRRVRERGFLESEVLPCLETFERTFPPELEPVLSYIKGEIGADLAYLADETQKVGGV